MPKKTSVTIEILQWILKEFKGYHGGDYLEITQHSTLKEGSFITEARISFRTDSYEKGLNDQKIQRIRDELDAITENSIKKIEFLESTAARYTNQSNQPQSGGTALLLKLEVFHKEKI